MVLELRSSAEIAEAMERFAVAARQTFGSGLERWRPSWYSLENMYVKSYAAGRQAKESEGERRRA